MNIVIGLFEELFMCVGPCSESEISNFVQQIEDKIIFVNQINTFVLEIIEYETDINFDEEFELEWVDFINRLYWQSISYLVIVIERLCGVQNRHHRVLRSSGLAQVE
jgi:hypothetical protein